MEVLTTAFESDRSVYRQISSVDLRWQRRFTGLLPLGRHAARPDGGVMLVKLDDLTPRTYHQFLVDRDGKPHVSTTLSVETLRKAEMSEDGSRIIAVTETSLYLFQDGKKQRMMPQSRVAYLDVMLSPDGKRVVVAASDMLYSRFLLSHFEIGGRTLWEEDFEKMITAIGTAPDEPMVAVGTESGSVILLDSERTQRWRFEHPGAVTALMVLEGGACLAGASPGILSLLDTEGTLQWSYHSGGDILSLDAGMDGSVVAVASRAVDGNVTLVCLDGAGALVWEHRIPGPNCSLAFSSDGRYLAVVGGGGRVWLFEVCFGEAVGTSPGEARRHFEAATTASADGDEPRALRELETVLKLDPAHLEACDQLNQLKSKLIQEALGRVAALEKTDPAEAYRQANQVLSIDPLNQQASGCALQLRKTLVETQLAAAAAALESEQLKEALAALKTALELEFTNRKARELLAETSRRISEALVSSAESFASEGKLPDAIREMERALGYRSDPAIAARLRELQAAQAFETGMAHYQASRYAEAIYQFNKTINLQPNHKEAQRYLRYAEKTASDNQISERFTKLE